MSWAGSKKNHQFQLDVSISLSVFWRKGYIDYFVDLFKKSEVNHSVVSLLMYNHTDSYYLFCYLKYFLPN